MSAARVPGRLLRRGWRRMVVDGLLAASRGGVSDCLRLFRELEQSPPAVVEEYQRLQLLRLLRHAHANVPYYRHLIESSDVDLSAEFDVSELCKLPLLTKETLRRHATELRSADIGTRRAFANSSGGSTGEPVVFLQDPAYHARCVVAAKLIYNEFLGKHPGDPEINLWGSERDIERGRLGLKQRAINFLYNRRFQNWFVVDDAKLARFVDEINRHRPVSLWAYVQSLELLAKFVRRRGLDVHSPRLIIATAGTLHEEVRELAQETFRCPVYNQYGCREAGAIAFEMQDRDGLRGFPYLNHVELVDGRVVLTNLVNYSMPLIRYEIGDTAEPWTGGQDARYGCRRKILGSVTGRVHSHFRTAGGGLVYGGYIAQPFRSQWWVRQFQVVQDSLDHVTCHIVLDGEPVVAELARIRSRIRRAMGPACEVEFRFAESIAPSPSGKHMHTICKIDEAT